MSLRNCYLDAEAPFFVVPVKPSTGYKQHLLGFFFSLMALVHSLGDRLVWDIYLNMLSS